MNRFPPCHFCGVCLLALHATAWSFEEEGAIPLTLEAIPGKLHIEQVAISIRGRDVAVTTRLRNDDIKSQRAAFFAYTPFFRRLGAGEMHADKTFADILVAIAGQSAFKPATQRRGFFMGQDITAALAAAGVPPLPDPDVHWKKLERVRFPHGIKAEDWQGFVSYSWTHTLAPGTFTSSTVRYRALPEFTRDNVDDERFARAVRSHCGDPAAAARLLRARGARDGAVQMERVDLPVRIQPGAEHTLEIIQPEKNWMGVYPQLTLVCGLENAPARASYAGRLDSVPGALSVLVISRLPSD